MIESPLNITTSRGPSILAHEHICQISGLTEVIRSLAMVIIQYQ